jgi:hypothetical protein
MNSSLMHAARITLAALRSTQRETGETLEDRVVIDGKSLKISDAVKELASHPKPLICRSGLSGNVLTISTAPARVPGPGLQAELEQFARDEQQYIRRVYAKSQVARVLIVDAHESFVVDDTVVGLWERDYRLPGVAYMFSEQRPTDHIQDADAAIVFWRTTRDRLHVSIQGSDQ